MDPTSARARRYHRRQLAFGIAAFLTNAAVLSAWVGTGAAVALARALAEWLPSRALVVLGLSAAVGGTTTALTFPLDLLRGFVLPRRAGLLTEPWTAWLADRAKALALAGALGLAVLELAYALLLWTPRWWWLAGAVCLSAGSVLLTLVVPIWIVPLFYRLTPLAEPDLRARLIQLAARAGVAAAEVLVADVSRKGPTANAAVVGLGRTRRIVVSDTLLSSFPHDEVAVVLAHELAHHACGHLYQSLALQTGLLVAVLGLAHRALGVWAEPSGLTGPADPAGLPLLALVLSVLGVLGTPLTAAWSRRLEREADRVALDVTRAPAAFVGAMERLGRLNLAERQPSRLKTWLSATHPPLEQRIAFARAAAERQAEAT